MKAYSIALYLICFTAGVVIMNSIFPNIPLKPYDGLDIGGVIASLMPKTTESLTADIIAMTTFSLLVYALNPILAILFFSVMILGFYLPVLGIPQYFTAPIILLVNIVFINGYNQFKARQSEQGIE